MTNFWGGEAPAGQLGPRFRGDDDEGVWMAVVAQTKRPGIAAGPSFTPSGD